MLKKIKFYIKIFRRAQGVVESVFAIGVLGLLMGGAVILIVMGVSNRQTGFDRRKAMELITIVSEELVAKSQDDPEHFWLYEVLENQPKDGFPGYFYSVGYTNVSGNPSYPTCGEAGKIDCAEVWIRVDWPGKEPQSMTVNRFFTKK